MKKFLRILLGIICLLIAAYLLGPKPKKPELSKELHSLNFNISEFDNYVEKRNSSQAIKPDNQSRIYWNNDTLKSQTEYCLLYLHGFSASWYEGYPTHVNFAKRFQMNAYIPLLADHGLITDDALLNMTPDNLYESAKEALVAAHILGKKVIIMGASTGGTLALKLAAEFPEMVDGLMLLSPNVAINNPAAFLLSGHWGLQIARAVYDSKYRITNEDFDSKDCHYWYCKYRLEGTVFLQQLIDVTMKKEVFQKVKMPVFLGYYYKDEEHQDQVVLVNSMLEMFDQLGTPSNQKVKQAFPEAGDHVIGCELFSGQLEDVQNACAKFGKEVLKLSE